MTYVLNTLHAISTHTSTSSVRTIAIVIIIIILSLIKRRLGLENPQPDNRLFTMPCDCLNEQTCYLQKVAPITPEVQ